MFSLSQDRFKSETDEFNKMINERIDSNYLDKFVRKWTHEVAVVGPGSIIGEIDYYLKQPSSVTVTCQSLTGELYEADAEEFMKLIAHND